MFKYANFIRLTIGLMGKLLDLTDVTSSIIDKFNVLQVKAIEQLEACELTKMQFLFDGFLSKLPELAGMGGNLLTQGLAGIPAINGSTDGSDTTTVWIVYRKIVPQWEKEDWRGMGTSVQTLLASLVKLDAPEASV